MTDRNHSPLYLASFLITVVAGMIYLIYIKILGTQVDTILTILIGTFSVAAVSNLSRIINRNNLFEFAVVSFDEGRARKSLDNITDATFYEVPKSEEEKLNSWEPTASSLLAQDPTLALAKLRIDIERELRRIAFESSLNNDKRIMSMQSLIKILTDRDVIDREIVSAIMDVVPACNEAIHGGVVKIDVAMVVLDIGENVVQLLRTYPKEKNKLEVSSFS